jgi:hypothetical protein
MVNGTASFIGPSITVIWAPGGSDGTAPHFRSPGMTIRCAPCWADATVAAVKLMPNASAIVARCFMTISLSAW